MHYEPPKRIELTEEETQLLSRISEILSHDEWTEEVPDAMETLVKSLRARNAIPDARLRLFYDPELAETGKRSRQQVFENNGTCGNEILRHPHFVSYLKHFINGPDLPRPVIEGLCSILNESMDTSGMILSQYRKFARESVRMYGLDRAKAAKEFFRLGVEIGMTVDEARILRDAAHKTR